MSETKQIVPMPGVMDTLLHDMNERIDTYIFQRADSIFGRMDHAVDDHYYPPLMSREQCLEYLHLGSDASLNKLRKKGLKSHKDGRSVWYIRSEVDKFIMMLPGGE
ncbi:hypothetical protein [Lactiplantibacillus xiangfangensis]|uniref:hypothetical protein n=1 Tax=Lactiplantibacillus xiangfangensis TaxID=942150 RepID=UPI0038511874